MRSTCSHVGSTVTPKAYKRGVGKHADDDAETEMAERRGGADKGARYRRRPPHEDPPTLFEDDPF